MESAIKYMWPVLILAMLIAGGLITGAVLMTRRRGGLTASEAGTGILFGIAMYAFLRLLS